MNSDPLKFAAVQVAVDAPLKILLTYLTSPDFNVKRGDLVKVPLGSRQVNGVVIGPAENKPVEFKPKANKQVAEKKYQLKTITSLATEWPALTDPFLKWLEWLGNYYSSARPGGAALLSAAK